MVASASRPDRAQRSSSARAHGAGRPRTPTSREPPQLPVEQFRLLAETSRDVVFRYRLSPTPGYEYVSPSVLQLAGYTPDEVYADPELGFALVHPDDRPLFDDTLAGRRAAPDPFVLRWQRKDGTTIWVELRSTPFVGPDGSIGFDGVVRDVTAQKAAEDALRAAQQEAAQLARIMASADEALIGETLDGT